jgi:hypothetical protein
MYGLKVKMMRIWIQEERKMRKRREREIHHVDLGFIAFAISLSISWFDRVFGDPKQRGTGGFWC